jgi:hypothetical protein
MITISRSNSDLPRSNKNNFSHTAIIHEKSGQCQAFRNEKIENVRSSVVDSGYGDFTDEIIGNILEVAAGGQDA